MLRDYALLAVSTLGLVTCFLRITDPMIDSAPMMLLKRNTLIRACNFNFKVMGNVKFYTLWFYAWICLDLACAHTHRLRSPPIKYMGLFTDRNAIILFLESGVYSY